MVSINDNLTVTLINKLIDIGQEKTQNKENKLLQETKLQSIKQRLAVNINRNRTF